MSPAADVVPARWHSFKLLLTACPSSPTGLSAVVPGRLVLRLRGPALLRDPLPRQAGITLRRLQQTHHRRVALYLPVRTAEPGLSTAEHIDRVCLPIALSARTHPPVRFTVSLPVKQSGHPLQLLFRSVLRTVCPICGCRCLRLSGNNFG